MIKDVRTLNVGDLIRQHYLKPAGKYYRLPAQAKIELIRGIFCRHPLGAIVLRYGVIDPETFKVPVEVIQGWPFLEVIIDYANDGFENEEGLLFSALPSPDQFLWYEFPIYNIDPEVPIEQVREALESMKFLNFSACGGF